ncbi:ABC transporter ATP-binding protein [Streptomonospora salina]|uniref:ABC-2 type transport system ATP-binding protein n=1 Tax=Streptomonospora salina TaxID=104205 RepID=A0A841EHY5_9ACTN|nr:ABC transporter ATP-binding protein [Streptomonospora salina]MBB6000989.1 ABC-2 type transport system ATP-binding protein [Streptomonospora salina]
MPVIAVSNLSKRYGRKVAVEDMSFSVEEGEIFGILGPNGAGKTTTVECIAGLRTPDSGSVSVHGLDPHREAAELHHILGMQLQKSEMPDKLRVSEALKLYASFYENPADWRALMTELGLADKADSAFDTLSGGQKQRLSIALALVGAPKVAVLDELTTGLDPAARRDTWELVEQVRDSGVTVILVTHFMEEAERLCDRLAVIDDGKLVALDTPAGLVADVDAEQTVRFQPSTELDDAVLTALPEVASVERRGRQVVVTGTGNLVHAVTSALVHHRIVAADLRAEQAGLDDAFIALTGRRFDQSAD